MKSGFTEEYIKLRIADLSAALTSPDTLMAVIRGHLYIEAEVQHFIDSRLLSPKQFPPKLDFEQRLAIAFALGLPIELRGALLKIGWLRNQFAHRLDFDITKPVADSLYQALGSFLQKQTKEFYAGIQRDNPRLPEKFIGLETRDRITAIIMSVYSTTAIAVRGTLGEVEVRDRELARALGLTRDSKIPES